jgi:hypothetical protein
VLLLCAALVPLACLGLSTLLDLPGTFPVLCGTLLLLGTLLLPGLGRGPAGNGRAALIRGPCRRR